MDSFIQITVFCPPEPRVGAFVHWNAGKVYYPIALEKCKKNVILFKLFWYKVFVHLKLKLLNLLMDSVLLIITIPVLKILPLVVQLLDTLPYGHRGI